MIVIVEYFAIDLPRHKQWWIEVMVDKAVHDRMPFDNKEERDAALADLIATMSATPGTMDITNGRMQ